MKLILACDSYGVKITILLTDDASLTTNVTINGLKESYVPDPMENFRIKAYKLTLK
ncbi:hypothetical protein [Legionella waltersii]|uniref:Uncharacterized protein n=1 Tax=Legionella waltersii TaxID=66969 RepID=A0A0W1AK65_9GAMM|nr:hypothetical protein [Legionella waltersii]KTD81754.1 hypothetical protein Lwal_1006 [Legionella waltersii]SNU97098.1 Uncharacterised protein [Legionella waltersii]